MSDKPYKSIALWAEGVVEGNKTEDTHETFSQAKAVCEALHKDGFGGEGKIFPVECKVETPDVFDESHDTEEFEGVKIFILNKLDTNRNRLKSQVKSVLDADAFTTLIPAIIEIYAEGSKQLHYHTGFYSKEYNVMFEHHVDDMTKVHRKHTIAKNPVMNIMYIDVHDNKEMLNYSQIMARIGNKFKEQLG